MDERERMKLARARVRREAFLRMAELGLTQTELAERAGVSAKTVYRFLSTDSWREAAVLRALAEALDWPPDELERRVDRELARQDLHELERQVPGTMVLSFGEDTLAGLAEEDMNELRATLHATALRTIGEIRARTPGRGLAHGHLSAVGA